MFMFIFFTFFFFTFIFYIFIFIFIFFIFFTFILMFILIFIFTCVFTSVFIKVQAVFTPAVVNILIITFVIFTVPNNPTAIVVICFFFVTATIFIVNAATIITLFVKAFIRITRKFVVENFGNITVIPILCQTPVSTCSVWSVILGNWGLHFSKQ